MSLRRSALPQGHLLSCVLHTLFMFCLLCTALVSDRCSACAELLWFKKTAAYGWMISRLTGELIHCSGMG